MPIVSVSRWDIDHDTAARIVREVSPTMKKHGATNVLLGRIHAGQDAGQTTVVVTYSDFATFGKALEAQQKDSQYQQQYAQALKAGRLMGRNIVITEEIS